MLKLFKKRVNIWIKIATMPDTAINYTILIIICKMITFLRNIENVNFFTITKLFARKPSKFLTKHINYKL